MKEKMHKTEFEKMLERKAAEEAKQKEAEAAKQQEEAPEESAVAGNADDQLADVAEETEAATEKEQAQADVLQAECEQLKDQLLRARAEFDNYRKRMLRDMDQLRQTASVNLIRILLPILDNLERALAHANSEDGLAEGVRLVYKQLMDALAAEGLTPIPARGEPFDPTVHEALATVPSEEIAQGLVAEEYERGYKLRDLVVRPSKVIVSSGPEAEVAEAPCGTEEIVDDTDSSGDV